MILFYVFLVTYLLGATHATNLVPCCESDICNVTFTGVYDMMVRNLLLNSGRYHHALNTDLLERNFAYASMSRGFLQYRIFDQEGYDFFLLEDNCQWSEENMAFEEDCEDLAIDSGHATVPVWTCLDCAYDELHIITFNGGDSPTATVDLLHFHTTNTQSTIVGDTHVLINIILILVAMVFFITPILAIYCFNSSASPSQHGSEDDHGCICLVILSFFIFFV